MSKKIKHLFIIISIILLTLFRTGLTYPDSGNIAKFEIAKENFRKGMKFFNKMRYLAAAEFFRKAVKEYPDYLSARDYLARSYKLAGFIDEALQEFENLREISPENVFVSNKIDNIRFRDSGEGQQFDISGLVLNSAFVSSKMKRFGFPKPVDIAVDNEKNIYITSFSSGKLIKIDAGGKGVSIIKPDFKSMLYGIDIHDDRIAVTDFKLDKLYLMNKSGKIIREIGTSGNGNGRFYGPQGVCFDKDGYIYVVDSGNNRIQKLDSDGNFILKFGIKGEYEGRLNHPADIVFLKGRLYITDRGNRRIAVFDDSGNFIKNFSPQGLEMPGGISKMRNMLLISDQKRGLLLYDTDRNSGRWFYYRDGVKETFSKLISTVVDRDGYLYCLDYNYESVFYFSPVERVYSNLEVEITSVDIEKFPVVAFYVNIRNRNGTPLYNLNAGNFRITEDSAPVSGLYVDYLKKITPSVSIVLCVDRSLKSEGFHNEVPWVSDFILKKMRSNDRIKLINFNNDYWQGNGFDWSRRRTLYALRKRLYTGREGRGKTRIYNKGKRFDRVLYNAISDLLPRLNRRAVVLVTDGAVYEDSFQQYTPKNIINYARSHYIPIYIISFRKPDEVLRRIADETGGGLFRAGNPDRLRDIYRKIKKSEEYRYVLVYSTYKPLSFSGWWSDVRLEVNYRKQKGIEWGGYFVPKQ